jgi:hypothetical protein
MRERSGSGGTLSGIVCGVVVAGDGEGEGDGDVDGVRGGMGGRR